jgi:hypothetical protein
VIVDSFAFNVYPIQWKDSVVNAVYLSLRMMQECHPISMHRMCFLKAYSQPQSCDHRHDHQPGTEESHNCRLLVSILPRSTTPSMLKINEIYVVSRWFVAHLSLFQCCAKLAIPSQRSRSSLPSASTQWRSVRSGEAPSSTTMTATTTPSAATTTATAEATHLGKARIDALFGLAQHSDEITSLLGVCGC